MTAPVQPIKAFYYPHVDFGSAAWVKGALLYWEAVVRHTGGPVDDGDAEIRALHEAGLIEDVDFRPYWEKITPVLGKRLERILHERGELPDTIPGTTTIRGHTSREIAERRAELARELDGLGFRRAAKALRTKLEQTLTVYLVVGADVISRDRNLAPVTDDPIFEAISTYCCDEAKPLLESPPVQAGVVFAELLVPTPPMQAVARMPVKRLLEIREKLAHHRHSFREKVEAQASAIAGLPSADAVERRVKDFAREIRADLDAHHREMKSTHVQWAGSLLRIMAPISIAAGLALSSTSPVAGPIGTIGSVVIEATGWFMHRRAGNVNRTHYILEVEEALGQKGASPRALHAGLERLLGKKAA
jgi:hypothetical protein